MGSVYGIHLSPNAAELALPSSNPLSSEATLGPGAILLQEQHTPLLLKKAMTPALPLVFGVPTKTNTHDFHDGKSDIAWCDNASNTAVWLMSGAGVHSVRGGARLSAREPAAWKIVEQRDFDDDGKCDWL